LGLNVGVAFWKVMIMDAHTLYTIEEVGFWNNHVDGFRIISTANLVALCLANGYL